VIYRDHVRRSVDAWWAVAFRNYKRNGSDCGAGDNGMPDELTDYQIALLCDIEEGDLTKFAGDRKRDLERQRPRDRGRILAC
jgi:hypothetical protein